MLYDPKWEQKTSEPSLAGLIAWLETQSPETTYNPTDPHTCLIGQYWDCVPFLSKEMPWAARIAFNKPYTFGDALARARAAQTGQE